MTKKQGIVVLMIGLLALAAPAICAAGQVEAALEKAIIRAAMQQDTATPQVRQLMGALRSMARSYNQIFERENDLTEKRRVAGILERSISVPNDYKCKGLKAICAFCIPDSHGDKEVAQLEYYVKLYTLSEQEIVWAQLLEKALPDTFLEAYGELQSDLAKQMVRNEKDIIAAMAKFAVVYEQMLQDNDITAGEVNVMKKSLFHLPIKTGWDKSVSLQDLTFRLGMRSLAGGDAFERRTATDLQQDFQATPEDAKVFASFVSSY